MGRCETTSASIGIKILLSDLILQINETNFMIIKDMLHKGYIEDANDYFYEMYSKIVSEMPKDFLNFKEYLTSKLKNNGSYHKSRDDVVIPTLDKGCLFDKFLLVPIKEILTMDRWGYTRDGCNAISRPIDFDLSVDIDKYKSIGLEGIQIVFLLGLYSG